MQGKREAKSEDKDMEEKQLLRRWIEREETVEPERKRRGQEGTDALSKVSWVSTLREDGDTEVDEEEVEALSSPPETAAKSHLDGSEFVSVYFVRHGQALHNATPDGWKKRDPPLTAWGETQAKGLRDHPVLRTLRRPFVVVSPLRRALQTASLGFDCSRRKCGRRRCLRTLTCKNVPSILVIRVQRKSK